MAQNCHLSNKFTYTHVEKRDDYALVKNQFRRCIAMKMNKIETEASPAVEYILFSDPEAWRHHFNVGVPSFPEEVLLSVFEEASSFAKEKLREYVEENVRRSLDTHPLSGYYREHENVIPVVIRKVGVISGTVDINADIRKTYQELFEKCKAHIKAEESIAEIPPAQPTVAGVLSASGFDNTLQRMENALKIEEPDRKIVEEGKKLHDDLSSARRKRILNVSWADTVAWQDFVNSVKTRVKKSEPVLKKSPVWKQFLLDILNALIFISTLGISYALTGSLRLFRVQQPKESAIEEMKTMKRSFDPYA